MRQPLIEINNLSIKYKEEAEFVLKNLNLTIYKQEIVGIVGQSGCGKSTLAKVLVGLVRINIGEIFYEGSTLHFKKNGYKKLLRKSIQIVFQDPSACLNPRTSVEEILLEPLHIHENDLCHRDKIARVKEILSQVGLNEFYLSYYPHELSGGQKQRVCIARSLIIKPEFLIFDEAVSALDASIQAQILNLLKELQKKNQFTLLFISHDLEIVRYISDRIVVLSSGEIVEIGDAEKIFSQPNHPYTKKLVALTHCLI
jgi:ABC-type glutathione transport system ATPase component